MKFQLYSLFSKLSRPGLIFRLEKSIKCKKRRVFLVIITSEDFAFVVRLSPSTQFSLLRSAAGGPSQFHSNRPPPSYSRFLRLPSRCSTRFRLGHNRNIAARPRLLDDQDGFLSHVLPGLPQRVYRLPEHEWRLGLKESHGWDQWLRARPVLAIVSGNRRLRLVDSCHRLDQCPPGQHLRCRQRPRLPNLL
jgi:hypothetical protein